MGVVACGVGPLVGRVRSRTGPVKRDTFLRAESPGTFTLWGPQKSSRTGRRPHLPPETPLPRLMRRQTARWNLSISTPTTISSTMLSRS